MPSLRTWACAVALVPLATSAVALADDAPPPTEREKKLEQRVEELERRLAEVNSKLESGANRAGDELDARVAEIEKLTKPNKGGLFAYWSNTIRMDSADGAFKLRIGGRLQNDWSWFWRNHDLEAASGKQIEAGEEFRRARLQVGGTIYKNVEFMAEYDFAGGVTKFREVWIGLTNLCGAGRLQIGSFKEPFGLEENTSDLFTTFVERSAPSEAFAPSYNTGVMLSDTCADQRVTWQVGLFRDANDQGNDTGNTSSGEYNLTGRIAGRPLVDDEHQQYVHLGVAGSVRNPSSDTAGFAAHPELRLAPVLVDTGALASNRVYLGEAEAAIVSGPFHGTAEYYAARVNGTDGGPDPRFHGWATQASWFLTGESRPYKPESATFGRITPKANFDGEGGPGAWELAARYDALNLNDDGVDGGHLRTMTLGVTWYLNPNTKVMLDWVRTHLVDAGRLYGLEMRFQIDF
jgi:phosphate-selective porin OprO and OprP